MVQFFVDDIDYTPGVQSVGGNPLGSLSYTVTFTEPSNTSVLALKGLEQSEVLSAGLRLTCVCDRPGSPWNFFSEVNTGWVSVSSIRSPSFEADNFRDGWYSNNYTGPSSPAIAYTGPAIALNLTTQVCGPQQVEKSLGHPQGLQSPRSWYWGLRRQVVQPQICGTNAPIQSPTLRPTLLPTIGTPTLSPTSSVPTRVPTGSTPTTNPSTHPITSTPSFSPAPPLNTEAPSIAPTNCDPGIVTCCFTAQEEVRELWVNEIDVTPLITPASGLADPLITKTITFTEPSTDAVFV